MKLDITGRHIEITAGAAGSSRRRSCASSRSCSTVRWRPTSCWASRSTGTWPRSRSSPGRRCSPARRRPAISTLPSARWWTSSKRQALKHKEKMRTDRRRSARDCAPPRRWRPRRRRRRRGRGGSGRTPAARSCHGSCAASATASTAVRRGRRAGTRGHRTRNPGLFREAETDRVERGLPSARTGTSALVEPEF